MARGAVGAQGCRADMTTTVANGVEAIRDRVRDAVQRGAALRIAGRGTWLDAGRPVSSSDTISTREHTGITEYVPGDLVLTARAGTPLGEIRDATAAHGQWLALNPYGTNEGTIGATIATGAAGPLSTFFGRARDLVLGVQFVTGEGVVARGGGRVVKNVAGFDLTRLITGSWGTLGVVTEVTMRLHARPEADESFAIPVAEGGALERVRRLLRQLPFAPYSCEVVNATLAQRLVGTNETTALVRIGGNREAVRAQHNAFAELGDAREIDARVWDELRGVEPRDAIVFRLSRLPSHIERVWAEASAIAARCPGTLLHATPSRGVVRCVVPSTSADNVRQVAEAFALATDTIRLGERLPMDLWSTISPAVGADGIPARIKRTFDPAGVLNPGILGGAT
jgi:glycolate oxidase FAD binding subunit